MVTTREQHGGQLPWDIVDNNWEEIEARLGAIESPLPGAGGTGRVPDLDGLVILFRSDLVVAFNPALDPAALWQRSATETDTVTARGAALASTSGARLRTLGGFTNTVYAEQATLDQNAALGTTVLDFTAGPHYDGAGVNSASQVTLAFVASPDIDNANFVFSTSGAPATVGIGLLFNSGFRITMVSANGTTLVSNHTATNIYAAGDVLRIVARWSVAANTTELWLSRNGAAWAKVIDATLSGFTTITSTTGARIGERRQGGFFFDGKLIAGPYLVNRATTATELAWLQAALDNVGRKGVRPVQPAEIADAGTRVSPDPGNTLTANPRFWAGTQTALDAIPIKDPNTIYHVLPG
jgi:hypothetical protein